jgi:hypothetical protein
MEFGRKAGALGPVFISERQEAHLPLPFALEAAFGKENQVVDSLSDRDRGSYFEDPGIG